MSSTAMSQRLEAAIVGCGQIAGGYAGTDGDILTHAAAYREHPDFDLIACVEPDEARRSAFQTRWSVPNAYPTLAALLTAQPRLKVVSLCTPSPLHAEDLRTLLASAVPAVFCEKPITTGLAEAEALVTAYEGAGKILTVNHTRRFDPAILALRDRLAKGELGGIRAASGVYTGGILNNGSHWIDLACMLLGRLTLEHVLRATVDRDADDPTVDAILRDVDGLPVHLMGADSRDYALFELRLVAEHAVIDIEERGFVIRERRPEADPRFPGFRRLGNSVDMVTGLHQSLRFGLDAMRDALAGHPPSSTGRTALQAQRLCEAMRLQGLLQLEMRG